MKDRKIYRVIDARRTKNGRWILVSGPNERVSDCPAPFLYHGTVTPETIRL